MRPLVAHIDLAAITHNYALARQCAPGRQALAVVKADAYGHGLEPVVAALSDADGFAVACLEEAERVRRVASQARLLLLEGCFAVAEYQRAAELGVDVVLHSAEQAEGLLASVLPAPLRVWLKLDSGMHRLGFGEAALRHWHARLQAASQVSELNLISHFACADERGNSLTELQLERFLDVLDLPHVNRLLVLNAGCHGDTLDDVLTAFKTDGSQQAILSKVDEAVKLGPAIDALIRHQMVLRGVTNGQRVPEDWERANAHQLISASMRSPAKSAFDPKATDLNFFFSHSPDTVTEGGLVDA